MDARFWHHAAEKFHTSHAADSMQEFLISGQLRHTIVILQTLGLLVDLRCVVFFLHVFVIHVLRNLREFFAICMPSFTEWYCHHSMLRYLTVVVIVKDSVHSASHTENMAICSFSSYWECDNNSFILDTPVKMAQFYFQTVVTTPIQCNWAGFKMATLLNLLCLKRGFMY